MGSPKWWNKCGQCIKGKMLGKLCDCLEEYMYFEEEKMMESIKIINIISSSIQTDLIFKTRENELIHI